MTMSLAGPGLTTTNTKKRKAKSFTKHDHAAAIAHDKWLRKMGTHPDQLKARKKKPVNTLPFERDRSHERQGNAAPSAGVGAGVGAGIILYPISENSLFNDTPKSEIL